MSDLTNAFDALLKDLPEVVVDVSPDALVFQGERVLEGAQPEGSIPFALYRDGVRRLGFLRGLTSHELEAVVAATAQGLSFGGMGDDVVSMLWRHQLAHVRYEAIDTSIEAAGADADRVYKEIESITGALGGHQPGLQEAFQPIPRITVLPAYRDDLVKELAAENEHSVAERAARVLVRGWHEAKDEEAAEVASSTLLKMFDAALVNDDARLAAAIARGVRALPHEAERVIRWLNDAGSEARLRRLIPMLEDQPGRQEEVLAVIDAIGRPAVPAIFALLPAMLDAPARRALSERIVRFGVDDLGPVKELVNREPIFLAQEAIFVLGRIGSPEAQSAIRDARVHPKLHVRLALVEQLRHVPAELALNIALDLLGREEDPKVLAAIARALPRYKTKETADALDTAANRVGERPLPYDTKLAILVSFASLNSGRALPLLARYVRRGEGLLVRRDAEELAAAAVRALGSIRGQRNSEIVEKAMQSRSKLVREAAKEVLAQGEAS
jgi:hypothetical protein